MRDYIEDLLRRQAVREREEEEPPRWTAAEPCPQARRSGRGKEEPAACGKREAWAPVPPGTTADLAEDGPYSGGRIAEAAPAGGAGAGVTGAAQAEGLPRLRGWEAGGFIAPEAGARAAGAAVLYRGMRRTAEAARYRGREGTREAAGRGLTVEARRAMDLEALDRAFQRDARRYDGGFERYE